MWNFGCEGHFIGEYEVVRNLYQDDVFISAHLEKRWVFASKLGRYIIYGSKQIFLTNDNQFDDHNYSLDLTKFYDYF
jgi:hypothetical protein